MNTRERRRALLAALPEDKRIVAELAARFDVTTGRANLRAHT